MYSALAMVIPVSVELDIPDTLRISVPIKTSIPFISLCPTESDSPSKIVLRTVIDVTESLKSVATSPT